MSALFDSLCMKRFLSMTMNILKCVFEKLSLKSLFSPSIFHIARNPKDIKQAKKIILQTKTQR